MDGVPAFLPRRLSLTNLDRVFDHTRHERSWPRYVNLLLLASEPSVLTAAPDAARILAGENLSDTMLDKFLTRCERGAGLEAGSCVWVGADEFTRRASRERFLQQLAPTLGDLGRPLPRDFRYVQQAQLGDYDAARGGFPLRVAGYPAGSQPLQVFDLVGASVFGVNRGRVQAIPEPVVPYPSIWRVPATEAEALIKRLTSRPGGASNRAVALAWHYRIVRIEPSRRPYSQSARDVIVQPLTLSLYADAQLTEPLGILPLGKQETAAAGAPGTKEQTAAAPARAGQPFAIKPAEFPRIESRILLDPRPPARDPIVAANVRYLNLLLLAQEPDLAKEDGAAVRLAHQNLGGLTAPNQRWAGASEFDRGRAEATFRDSGLAAVLKLARTFALPQAIVIRRRAALEEYDFERQGFPIRLEVDGLDRVSGFSAQDDFGRDTRQGLLHSHYELMVNPSSVTVRWTNSAGPTLWRVSEQEASSVVAGRPAHAGRRTIYLATAARLVGLGKDDQDRHTFEGEVLEVGIYWDRALTERAGSLPAALR